MTDIYRALYALLSYITEDAVANKLHLNGFPKPLLDKLNECCIELGAYLDKIE